VAGYRDTGQNGPASAVSDAPLLDDPYPGLDADLRRSPTELVHPREVPAVLVAHELAQAPGVRRQAGDHRLGVPAAGVGAHPGGGVGMTGMVTGCKPYGTGWEAGLAIGAGAITCRPELADD
jgi:hypothetical protein